VYENAKVQGGTMKKDKFVITTRPCKVCGAIVEYVNGETDGCHSCHEGRMNQE
tara:strand:+ start:272 stop:430 length:159 start_codon:yes stop_codon:yes gene_type:complete